MREWLFIWEMEWLDGGAGMLYKGGQSQEY